MCSQEPDQAVGRQVRAVVRRLRGRHARRHVRHGDDGEQVHQVVLELPTSDRRLSTKGGGRRPYSHELPAARAVRVRTRDTHQSTDRPLSAASVSFRLLFRHTGT